MKFTTKKWLPFFVLGVLTAYFCHRLYGVCFSPEGDVLLHINSRLNIDLLRADHDPFRGTYSSFLPVLGLANPIPQLVSAFLSTFTSLSPIELATFINMISSGISLFLLVISVFLFLRAVSCGTLASLLGAIICGFTGFQVIGVRQFDQFYLLSFAAVCPVLYAFLKIIEGEKRRFWISIAAMSIGGSLLSGSNSPLFMYLPFFFLLPFLGPSKLSKERNLAVFVGAVVLGCLAGAVTLLPGIVYLSDMNRVHLEFEPAAKSQVTLFSKLLSFFLRDWAIKDQVSSYRVDFYLGATVLALALHGILVSLKGKMLGSRRTLDRLMLVLLVSGLIILNFEALPFFIQIPIGEFFSALSIRFSHRFFMMCLLPIAYFAARGMDGAFDRRFRSILAVFLSFEIALVVVFLMPRLSAMPADMKVSASVSLCFGFLSGLFLIVSKSRKAVIFSVSFIYLMFVYAPLQRKVFELYSDGDRESAGVFSASWKDFLGFDWNYSGAVRRSALVIGYIPQPLRAPATIEGRVIGPAFTNDKSLDFYAIRTHHQLAFENLTDPASPKRILELSRIITSAVLDLYGVCWVPSPTGEYIHRDSCFPTEFLVPSVRKFANDSEVLHWMKNARHSDFETAAAVVCAKSECEDLPASISSLPKPHLSLRTVRKEPGHFTFEVDPGQKALLFVSTVFRFDWKATVNGVATHVYRANHAFIGIPVGPERAIVDLFLSDEVRLASFGITFLTFLFLMGLIRMRGT